MTDPQTTEKSGIGTPEIEQLMDMTPPIMITIDGARYHRTARVMDLGTGVFPRVIINGWSYAKWQ